MVDQGHRRPLALGQRGQGCRDEGGDLAPLKLGRREGLRSLGSDPLQPPAGETGRCTGSGPPGTATCEAEPWGASLAMAPQPEERFLSHIFRLRRVPKHPIRKPRHRRKVPVEQAVERRAFARPEPRHE